MTKLACFLLITLIMSPLAKFALTTKPFKKGNLVDHINMDSNFIKRRATYPIWIRFTEVSTTKSMLSSISQHTEDLSMIVVTKAPYLAEIWN